MDIEAVAARRIKAAVEVPVFLEVPSDMPDEFVTVELTGGGADMFDQATLAIQSWASTRRRAREVATAVCAAVHDLDVEENLFNPQVESTYRWPDPDTRKARYQTVATVWVCE